MLTRRSLLFVNYRRDDTGPYAIALKSELELRLEGNAVFLDLAGVRAGKDWQLVLEDALSKSRIVLSCIGENWHGTPDETGRRRIDDPNDWIRRELAQALIDPKKVVIPVLINDAAVPRLSEVPEEIRSLCSRQAFRIRSETWTSDIVALCQRLSEEDGVAIKGAGELLPKPSRIKRLVEPLSDSALARAEADGLLPGWICASRADVMGRGPASEMLQKSYRFTTDRKAYEFLKAVGDLAVDARHHPEMSSKFRDVEIKLTTWDAGNRITVFDLELIQRIEAACRRIG
ncbi:4a-hydroxytetrahydrobiopterin dehydratase [Methylobacterium radiotolerans]|uniref:4a-hydroxytetrahydrobiopterin dehydratase n=1 Tax=Methylobacterium radiotolerans TaxID=31998 RepID=UPI000D5D24F8|nr:MULTISPECIES: 4a-hydroxytetrahydrobiopterin dehydratase [Methylobacterium]MDE3745109.1 4a-hydroxytetrahydrobiopterin dehydratase [Methylobacterium radiotolerans]PVY95449.1 pterin-4a-carbinolamine dehydratase [Methylobacterium organophilum]